MSAPAPTKTSAYGPNTSAEPNHRKTWDRSAYAARASAREAHEAAESKARWEAKQAGQKYHAHLTPEELTSARTSRLDVSGSIGKTQILTGGMSAVVGKRGRGAGFYCEKCDLTFKDNLQWVEHLNSKGHLVNSGESVEVRRASLEEVRERLRGLKERRMMVVDGVGLGLEERLGARIVQDEREREERRAARREKRRRVGGVGMGEGGGEVKVEGVEGEGERDEEDVMALMGFQGFGSTKV